MRTTETIMVEKVINTASCDIEGCSVSTTHNSGCFGHAPIMKCEFCEQDCCKMHRKSYWESHNDDHPTLTVCSECASHADEVWEVANFKAGRYDILTDVIKEVKGDWETYKWWIDGSETPELDMLWHTDYYDGPLAGVAEYSVKRYGLKLTLIKSLVLWMNGDMTFMNYQMQKQILKRNDMKCFNNS